MTERIRITGTGVHVHMEPRRERDERFAAAVAHAQKAGEHLWIAVLPFYVADPDAETLNFDSENLADTPTIGCYICEQPYEHRQRHRRCPGDPEGRTRLR